VRDLAARMRASGRPFARSTVNDKLTGASRPSWEFVEAFVAACANGTRLNEADLHKWRAADRPQTPPRLSGPSSTCSEFWPTGPVRSGRVDRPVPQRAREQTDADRARQCPRCWTGPPAAARSVRLPGIGDQPRQASTPVVPRRSSGTLDPVRPGARARRHPVDPVAARGTAQLGRRSAGPDAHRAAARGDRRHPAAPVPRQRGGGAAGRHHRERRVPPYPQPGPVADAATLSIMAEAPAQSIRLYNLSPRYPAAA
jgi:hypothetical protein